MGIHIHKIRFEVLKDPYAGSVCIIFRWTCPQNNTNSITTIENSLQNFMLDRSHDHEECKRGT